LLMCSSGCVIGRIQPSHFQFVTVVEKTEPGAGGWRAACVHAKVTNGGTKASIICRFGVEMPVENYEGPISIPLAQRVSADCANTAADIVLGSATDETPLGLLCENFKTAYDSILNRAIAGAHVTKMCHRLAKPIKFGF
jgi:hypothetical protein